MKNYFEKLKKNLFNIEKNLIQQLNKIKTNNINANLIDHIKIKYFGNFIKINQIASINIIKRIIIIKPFEKKIIKDIEKALLLSNIGIIPINDGDNLKLNIPLLTEERKLELKKIIKKEIENSKIKIRNLRHDLIKKFKIEQKNGLFTLDEVFIFEKKIQEKILNFLMKLEIIKNKKYNEL